MSSVTTIQTVAELDALAATLKQNLPRQRERKLEDIVATLGRFADVLGRSSAIGEIEGLAFLVFWLRPSNLNRLIGMSLNGGAAALEQFTRTGNSYVRAQPIGLVCHWTAGNVPTISFFSWLLSLLTKNVALLRVSRDSIDATNKLLQVLAEVPGPLSGKELLASVEFIHFDHSDQALQTSMSQHADCKVIWGGHDAVSNIMALPRNHHCNEIIFGPKYSVGVIGACRRDQRGALQEAARAFVRDALIFDQRACSSPQTIFFEKGELEPNEVLEIFSAEMASAAKATPKRDIDDYTASKIFLARALWGLDTARAFRANNGADWTICLDQELALKEAVQSRTLFLVGVQDAEQVVPLLDTRIQCVGLALMDSDRLLRFADAATARGVSRCTKPGLMNVYDLPWDGRLVLSDMVRWVSLTV